MVAQAKDAAWMEWVKTWIRGASWQEHAAMFPSDRFYCLLDQLPVHLLGRRAADDLSRISVDAPLFRSPDCEILTAPELPAEMAFNADLVANFVLQGGIAWVRDSGSRCRLPFWLGPNLESAVRELRPEQDARHILSPQDCRVLAMAGVLCSPKGSTLASSSDEKLDELRRGYSAKNYAMFPGVLHPFHVAALRRYYRSRIRQGAITLGDSQSSRRYVAHNESVAQFFHHQLTPMASAVAGEPVKPSYVYMASYLSGAELKKHTDREQCEFSISLCLDFAPEPEGTTPWPLCLDTPEGIVRVYQNLGDGLFYFGTRVPHYRDILGEGFTSTSIFFHYVPESFTGSLD